MKRGFAREDLFTVVHEQFMTETAAMADIVLPATMFLEHDDLYQGGGHQHIMLGPKLVEPPGECRSNHEVICGLAERLGAEHPRLRDDAARDRSTGRCATRAAARSTSSSAQSWIDVQPDFARAHFLDGFGYPDGKFRFKPDWPKVPNANDGPIGPVADDAGAARPLGA